jgi:predicted house-cleaning noncanonical NTP pyrophosphatase (MazG superfamily)
LVRDKIPQIIKDKEGVDAIVRRIDGDGEFLKYLVQKIIEEASELQNANGAENVKEELADILELIDNILIVNKITVEDVARIQEEKHHKNGGFEQRILMLGKNSR